VTESAKASMPRTQKSYSRDFVGLPTNLAAIPAENGSRYHLQGLAGRLQRPVCCISPATDHLHPCGDARPKDLLSQSISLSFFLFSNLPRAFHLRVQFLSLHTVYPLTWVFFLHLLLRCLFLLTYITSRPLRHSSRLTLIASTVLGAGVHYRTRLMRRAELVNTI